MTQIEGRDRKGNVVRLSRSQPLQLCLFQDFLGEGDRYSNTIELYDSIPKYFPSHRKMDAMRADGTFLPILKRDFQHRDRETGTAFRYKVEISPARVSDPSGLGEREFYPTAREELVEEALRKIACEPLSGVFLDTEAGVQFTLNQLQRELAASGHSMNYASLIEALEVCNKVNISLKSEDGSVVMSAAIFPVVVLNRRSDWLKNPRETKAYVQFNPLVTHSVNRLSYRQYDYARYMRYARQLARWLHKRLSHNFIYADLTSAYRIKASTIIRDSGLVTHTRLRDRIDAIDQALGELASDGIILGFDKEPRAEAHGKLVDAVYSLQPTFTFVADLKAANRRKRNNLERAKRNGHPLPK